MEYALPSVFGTYDDGPDAQERFMLSLRVARIERTLESLASERAGDKLLAQSEDIENVRHAEPFDKL